MKKFGHYEVTAELGRGGMGVVYKGWEPSLNRKVAIKCLGEHLLNDEALIERFTREAKATAALNDPNVIQIYYIGKEQNQPYFAMEYLDGQSLDEILKGGHVLSVNHAKNILKQACCGLSAAHKIDLVHRDIKPANIMITTDGCLKIVDFGIARTREYGDKLTNTGEFVGTPGYLSPEVCIGKEVDARSDIFSLGIVFYEMLAGKVPFENDSPLGLMLEVVQSDIPDIRELNNKVDKKTSFILTKMIAKNPDERYQTCDEIIRDLGNVVEKQPIDVLKKDANVIRHPVKSKAKISEQVTLPSGMAEITKNHSVLATQKKGSKSWLVAATLFAVVGAASVGYYQGYLPFPNKAKTSQATVLLDNQSSHEATASQVTLTATQQGESTSSLIANNNADNTDNKQNQGFFAGLGNMFADDTQADVAPIDDATAIDFAQAQAEAGFKIATVADEITQQQDTNQPSTDEQTLDAMKGKIVQSDLNGLVTVAHNTPTQVVAMVEDKIKSAPVEVETLKSMTDKVVAKSTYKAPAVILNKGVVVMAFGDPAVANPIEKIIESQLKQQGIKVMNEQFIPGMKALIEQGIDLAEMKKLIEKNGGQAMIIANVNYVGTQELYYANRATELVNAQIDIDIYDIKTGDSIGTGYGSQINYTALNATQQASDTIMQYTDELVSQLKAKI